MAPPDLLSPDFYADIDGMHDALRALRAQGPVWRDEANSLWAVLGHDEVVDVEARDEVFCSGRGFRALPMPDGAEFDMIALDDPAHAAQRQLVARRFTPKAVQVHAALLEQLIDELIDEVIDRGTIEVVDELAAPLPARMTAALLGFPDVHAASLRSWSERLMRRDHVVADEEVMRDFMGAILEFAQVVDELLPACRATPGDDLLSIWANAELDGCPMGQDVIVQEMGLFISGGAETTRTVISRGLVELARHPDDWEAMAADPSLVPAAVEELIRWVTPLNNFFRTVTRDDHIGEQPVAEGDRVVLMYPSANRDERVFRDPDVFDIRRSPNPHISFGFGTHFCLGASLARLELRMLLTALTRRITSLEVVEPPDIEPNIFVGAVRSCRLGFGRR
ncbi:MAG TPA: cytochrome P450 [Microthrixaceae bacterium]|nr:cytochrome P450 [Microthrixaceae bacterium]